MTSLKKTIVKALTFGPRHPHMGRALLAMLPAVGVMVATPAHACGGFFCSASAPVNQAAERIIFAQDGENTTQIVEILYEGPSENFAWVLPVPGVPTLKLSSKVALDRLQAATNPNYRLNTIFGEGCDVNFAAGSPSAADTSPATGGAGNGGPTVTVVAEGSVGPFDYQVLSVDAQDDDPAKVAIDWLSANEYDVGNLGGDVLRPYLANGLNLLALRLRKGQDAGAIQPVSLTFPGATPSIPIRPTAVAANEDMGVLVWILGQSRAVPTNYKGLELNESLINWFNPAANYNEVVTTAANQAGGQGFVTELAGPAEALHDAIDPGTETIDRSSYLGQRIGDVVQQMFYRFGTYDGFEKAFGEHVALRDGLTFADYRACTDCYYRPEYYVGTYTPADYGTSYDPLTDPVSQTDLTAFFDAIDESVLKPISEAADLFLDYPYVTRLYTTMSADEMTLDPVFDFNPDLEDVPNLHVADRKLECDFTSWTVTLPDGHQVSGQGNVWPIASDNTQTMPFNARVVSYKTEGAATVERDNLDEIASVLAPMAEGGAGPVASGSGGAGTGGARGGVGGAATGPAAQSGGEAANGSERAGGGCSTAVGGLSQSGSLMLMGMAGLLARRRRPKGASSSLR